MDSSQPYELTSESRARHLYLLGATGSGKTNLIVGLINQDVADHRTLALIDLRGDLVDRVLTGLAHQPRPDLQQRVTLIDLRDSDHVVGFNPLAGSGDPHARAYHVLDALKSQAASWGIQLEETLRNALIALATAGYSLLELEPLLVDQTFRRSVMQCQGDPGVIAFFDRYDALSGDKQQAWFLPVLNKVTPLLGIPRLRMLFGAPNPVDLSQSTEIPGSILLVALAVDRLSSAARLVGSLLVGAIESAIMARVDQPEANRVPVNLYIDEFETMASEAFQSIVAEGRRFRISLTLSHQNLSQLPTNLRQVIRNNVQTQVFFQTGSVDARELRHELQLEDGQMVLQTLPVGHALVVSRPKEPILVRFSHNVDPKVSTSKVRSFTELIHQAMGSLTPAETEQSIALRTSPIRSAASPCAGGPVSTEVRHDRIPRKPRGSK